MPHTDSVIIWYPLPPSHTHTLSIHPSNSHLSIHPPFIHLPIHLPTNPSIHPTPIYPSVHPPTHPPIHPSIHPSTIRPSPHFSHWVTIIFSPLSFSSLFLTFLPQWLWRLTVRCGACLKSEPSYTSHFTLFPHLYPGAKYQNPIKSLWLSVIYLHSWNHLCHSSFWPVQYNAFYGVHYQGIPQVHSPYTPTCMCGKMFYTLKWVTESPNNLLRYA